VLYIQFIGKISKRIDEFLAQGKEKRRVSSIMQFILAKKRGVEVLYSDGRFYYSELIQNSNASPPFYVSRVKLLSKKQIIVVYYSSDSDPNILMYRSFKKGNEDNYYILDNHSETITDKTIELLFDEPEKQVVEVTLRHNSNLLVKREERKLLIEVPGVDIKQHVV